MKTLKYLLFLFKHRKEARYIRRTGNTPLCGCKYYLKTSHCKHIEEAREEIKKFINNI